MNENNDNTSDTTNQQQEDQKKIKTEYYLSCVENDARIDCIFRLLDGIKFKVLESVVNDTPEDLRNTVSYSVMSEFLSFRKRLDSIISPETENKK